MSDEKFYRITSFLICLSILFNILSLYFNIQANIVLCKQQNTIYQLEKDNNYLRELNNYYKNSQRIQSI